MKMIRGKDGNKFHQVQPYAIVHRDITTAAWLSPGDGAA